MSYSYLHGLGVALVTPFDAHNSVDYEGLSRLLMHVEGAADYVVVMGTTGESVTLTAEEKAEVLSFIKSNTQLPIVYGIGGNNTAALVEEIKSTDLNGVSALLSSSPAYNKPPQRGIIKHYSILADTSPIPLILYNVPGRTASNLTADTTIELSKHSNIIGTKEASGDLQQCREIVENSSDDFLLLSGDDLFTPDLLEAGGVGLISVLGNAYPGHFKSMITTFNQNGLDEARSELSSIENLDPLMYEESNPVGVKQLLKELGVCEPYVRLPLVEASNDLVARIQAAMP